MTSFKMLLFLFFLCLIKYSREILVYLTVCSFLFSYISSDKNQKKIHKYT